MGTPIPRHLCDNFKQNPHQSEFFCWRFLGPGRLVTQGLESEKSAVDIGGEAKLSKLKVDFEEVTGKAFSHFYCPVLFRDEDVELCKAHIVNEAFSSVGRHWTVQRADVDSFYGRCFESDFIDIQHQGQITAAKSMVDKALARKFRPQILVKGDAVPYYYALPSTPSVTEHAKVQLEGDCGTVDVRLKLSPKELEATEAADLEIRIERDLRLPALVSLIKVAHLTLFEMLGYRYALSAGGHFIGRSILGEFYLENHNLSKKVVIEKAQEYFEEFSNLVRPVISHNPRLEGTAADNQLYVCETISMFLGPLSSSPERQTRFMRLSCPFFNTLMESNDSWIS